jgi:hypothetical protein
VAQWAIVRIGLGRVVVKEDREYCEKQEYNKTQRLRLDEVLDTYLLAIYQHTTRPELLSILRSSQSCKNNLSGELIHHASGSREPISGFLGIESCRPSFRALLKKEVMPPIPCRVI